MSENILYLTKDKSLQTQKAETNPHFITPKQSTLRQIIVEFPKTKNKRNILVTREK